MSISINRVTVDNIRFMAEMGVPFIAVVCPLHPSQGGQYAQGEAIDWAIKISVAPTMDLFPPAVEPRQARLLSNGDGNIKDFRSIDTAIKALVLACGPSNIGSGRIVQVSVDTANVVTLMAEEKLTSSSSAGSTVSD